MEQVVKDKFHAYIANRKESFIISDPGGEMFREMAGHFKEQGHTVRRFDMQDPTKSDGWDVLRTVNDDENGNVELLAQVASRTLVRNLVKDPNSIYVTGAISLMKALMLRVILGRDYPPEKKNIESVYELLQNPAGEDFLDTVFDADALSEEEKPCLGPYLTFKQDSQSLRGNILANLVVQLRLLQNKAVCKALSTDGIDPLLPAKQPCAYFFVFSDIYDTCQPIVTLFSTLMLIRISTFADNQMDGRCPIPVNFLMDEFPENGKIPDLSKKKTALDKRNIRLLDVRDIVNAKT